MTTSTAAEALAQALLRGQMPDAQSWDIAAAVQLLVDALAGPQVGLRIEQVRAAGRALNAHRHFEHTRLLARAWADRRGFDATLARQQAQALINLSALDEAERLLTAGLPQLAAPGAGPQAAVEVLEYQGLLGRVAKQRFVETGDLASLAEATARYLAQYRDHPDKPYWHGINTVALLARQQREGLPAPAAAPPVQALADALHQQTLARWHRNASDPWLAATLSEACLALDECDQAELWLYRFLHHPQVRPFDVDSYDRQLREIWQGSPAGGGNGCADRLAGLMARHLQREQSRLSVSMPQVRQLARRLASDPGVFERNFSGERMFGLDALRRLLAACESIGCVTDSRGERLGTGFLMSGSALKPEFGPAPVFVTNAHVISPEAPGALRPHEARITFEVESDRAGRPTSYGVDGLLFTSGPGDLGVRRADGADLDVTLVRLQGLADAAAVLPAARDLPLVNPKAKAFVAGHPRGSGLQISLHDSLLLDYDDEQRLVHYRTPTDPGNSGSPVFNNQWQVIAVHHGGSASTPRLRGSGCYEANEGIVLSAVQRALQG